MLSSFYLVRLTWNETRTDEPAEGEDKEYKTYLIGATMIGIPQFLYGRSPFASWGITSAYPDATDLFVEDIDLNNDTYLDALTGKGYLLSVEEITSQYVGLLVAQASSTHSQETASLFLVLF